MGAILGTQISQNSNVFLYDVCRKDFWRNNYSFHCIIVENSHFCEILSYFGPIWAISRYPEFLNFCPMHYLPSNDFQSAAFRHKHCFSCVFQKFWFPNDDFWAKMGVFGGFWGANFYWYEKSARKHLKHVYRVNPQPYAKIWRRSIFFFFGPLKLSFSQPGSLTDKDRRTDGHTLL